MGNRRSGQHGFLCRLGNSKLRAPVALRRGSTHSAGRTPCHQVFVDGIKGNRRLQFASDYLHREGRNKPKGCFDIARKFGVVPESVLPFTPPDLFQGRAKAFYAIASRLKIAMYVSLGRGPARWREWLAWSGPILTRLNVDDTWYAATDNEGELPQYKSETAGGGHAVSLVGYTTDGFIVRNSWGTDWGDGGFGYATEDYAEAAFTEAYGVVL